LWVHAQAIFRGFLLPSLAKYFPIGLSVFLSSVVFAAAHFSLQRFLPLMLLGIILGTLFVCTRNLMSCITFHSLWNAYIFYQLTCRATALFWA
jgi:membrane protease YdiL (CAAX protease family)